MFDWQTVTLSGMTYPTMDEFPHVTNIEEFIEHCARVSNPANQAMEIKPGKLIKYLIDHKHWSPFEMAHMTMKIVTTRDISRQMLRHRSFSFQEFSQRYSDVNGHSDNGHDPKQVLDDYSKIRMISDMENFVSKYGTPVVVRDFREQDTKNRQNSIPVPHSDKQAISWFTQSAAHAVAVNALYSLFVAQGMAKEQARAILPEGMTLSTLYMSGSVRSWIHYCDVRCGNGTQLEHIDVANKVRDVLVSELPSLKEYFNNAEQSGDST